MGDARGRGRPRSDAVHAAILEAARAGLRGPGYRATTLDWIARRAGVGKHTIYRRWPSVPALLLDALAEDAEASIPLPEAGDLQAELTAFLTRTFRLLTDTPMGSAVAALMAEAQLDPELAPALHAFVARRRAALLSLLGRAAARGDLSPEADPALLADLAYGPMWYRLLAGHAPLDPVLAGELASVICRVAATAPR